MDDIAANASKDRDYADKTKIIYLSFTLAAWKDFQNFSCKKKIGGTNFISKLYPSMQI